MCVRGVAAEKDRAEGGQNQNYNHSEPAIFIPKQTRHGLPQLQKP